jgi:hypothetical protein
MPSLARSLSLALALAWASNASAQPPDAAGGAAQTPAQRATKTARNAGPTIERVHIGFGEVAPGRYKVGTWTPVFVELMTDAPPFRGQVEVVVPDDDGVPTSVRVPVNLADEEKHTVVAQTRAGTMSAEFVVRLLDADGRPVPNLRSATAAPEPLDPGSFVVLVAGEVSGVNALPELAKFQTGRLQSSELVVSPLRDLPDEAQGFDGVDVIILDTTDEQVLKWLDAGADRAFRDWVAQGGHLVVTLGDNWQDDAVRRLDPILPARPSGPPLATDPEAVESFAAGSTKPLRGEPYVVPLEGWTERGGVPLAASAITPLVVRGPYGLGRVTLTGLNVVDRPFASWDDRVMFWDRLLELRNRAGGTFTFGMTGRGAIIQSAAPELAARLHRSLESFAGVRIVPFGWVAFFVFAYIVLIGPVDYLFLRKVVKRMELTWITFPLIVVGVSLVAYFGAYAYKGSDLRVNKVDLVDFDQARGTVRGRTWLTVFSPANHDYNLALQPHGPDFDPAGTSLDLASQSLSWFGSPDPILGGAGRIAFGQSGYRYEPPGETASLAGVRVQIWSTKSFTGSWAGRAGRAVVEPRLEEVSGDRLSGSIRNDLDHTLANARLFYGRNVYDLGTIRPGGIARVDPTRTEAISAYLGRTAQGLGETPAYEYNLPDRPASPDEVPDSRAEILRVAMFQSTLGNRADQFPSRALRDLDLSAQVGELRRPMLVAEVAAPAATLTLKDAPASPQVEQSSLLRVILPLGGEAEANPGVPPR